MAKDLLGFAGWGTFLSGRASCPPGQITDAMMQGQVVSRHEQVFEERSHKILGGMSASAGSVASVGARELEALRGRLLAENQ